MKCQTCGGSGLVSRPVAILYRVVTDSNRSDRAVTDEVGGPDACPTCTRRAEAEWKQKNPDG